MKSKLYKIIPLMLIIAFLLPVGACAADNEEVFDLNIEAVTPDDWFYEHVMMGIRFGIIQGATEEGFRFEPEQTITRSEFITMLGRMHEYGNDVIGTPGEGDERYLNWAVEHGILLGNGAGDLMPNALLRREQMVVIVDRYIEAFELWQKFSTLPVVDMGPADAQDISIWARTAINRLRDITLIGVPIDNFYPQSEISRAEGLQILVRAGSAICKLTPEEYTDNLLIIENINLTELFDVKPTHGMSYNGYIFSLMESASIPTEMPENIRVLFAPHNLFWAATLEDIAGFTNPEYIMYIEPDYIIYLEPEPNARGLE
jgi:hypothetical protein